MQEHYNACVKEKEDLQRDYNACAKEKDDKETLLQRRRAHEEEAQQEASKKISELQEECNKHLLTIKIKQDQLDAERSNNAELAKLLQKKQNHTQNRWQR